MRFPYGLSGMNEQVIKFLFILVSIMQSFGCGSIYSAGVDRRIKPMGEIIPTQNYSFAEELDLHVLSCGSGQPLIYIHGNYGSVLDIAKSPIYKNLCKRFRVIAFDRPGSGFSKRPSGRTVSVEQHTEAIVRLIEHYRLEQVSILAHSFGGAVAMKMAMMYPDKVKQLYLLAPAIYPWPGDKVFFKDRLVQIPFLGTMFLETLFVPIAYASSSSGYKEVFGTDDIPQDYFQPARALAVRPQAFLNTARDTSVLWETLERQSKEYRGISIPISVVHGTADSSVGLEIHSIPLQRNLPHVHLEVVNGAGHHPHFTHPDAVLSIFK